MQREFDALENKVTQFITACERLRTENQALRQQLALAQRDSKHLNDRIDSAKTRIEQLLARLPD